MTKRITSIILVTLLVVSLFAFVWCSNTDEMQQKIEDLQQVLQTQTEILTELQNTNVNNATQIANLQTALQEQAKQIEDMQKEMGELKILATGESFIDYELFEYKSFVIGFSYTDKEYSNVKNENATIIISSVEELKAYCNEKNNPAFDEQSSGYLSALSVKIREYDEEYFKTKSLIIDYGNYSHSGVTLVDMRIGIKDGIMTLYKTIEEEAGFDTLTFFIWFIEVSKHDIVDVETILNNF